MKRFLINVDMLLGMLRPLRPLRIESRAAAASVLHHQYNLGRVSRWYAAPHLNEGIVAKCSPIEQSLGGGMDMIMNNITMSQDDLEPTTTSNHQITKSS